MSEQPTDPPLSGPDIEHLAATLRRRKAELAGAAGVRIGDGEVVHELTSRMWVGLEVPAVLCAASADPLRLRAAVSPITCRRCRSRRSGAGSNQLPGQTTLM